MPALLRWIVTQISERLPPHLSERPHSNSDEAPWNDCHGRQADAPKSSREALWMCGTNDGVLKIDGVWLRITGNLAVGSNRTRLTIIKDSDNDEPRIARVKHLAVSVGQPTIGGNWHMLHRDGMIDVATNDADLRLVPSHNDIAMPDEPPPRQLLVRQLVPFAPITDEVTWRQRVSRSATSAGRSDNTSRIDSEQTLVTNRKINLSRRGQRIENGGPDDILGARIGPACAPGSSTEAGSYSSRAACSRPEDITSTRYAQTQMHFEKLQCQIAPLDYK